MIMGLHTIDDLFFNNSKNSTNYDKANVLDNKNTNSLSNNLMLQIIAYPKHWGAYDKSEDFIATREGWDFDKYQIFYIGYLYAQALNNHEQLPAGQYGYDVWAWCEMGRYDNEAKSQADIQSRINVSWPEGSSKKKNSDNIYFRDWNPGDSNKSAYAYATKLIIGDKSGKIRCDSSKIIYLARPADGWDKCHETKRANGSKFIPENRIGSVKAQDEKDFYILKKTYAKHLMELM